jgi:WD40 repeat protein
LASVSRDQTVRLWDAEKGTALRTFTGHESDVFALAFSRDGRRLYSGSRDQTVRVWDPLTGESLECLGGHGQFVTSLSLAPDGKRLAAGSWFGEVVLWAPSMQSHLVSFRAHDQPVRAVAFAPQGRWLATASYDLTIRLFDSASPQERRDARDRARSRRDAAERIIMRRSSEISDPDLLVRAVNEDETIDSETRLWARKLILARAADSHKPPFPAFFDSQESGFPLRA